MILRLMTFCLAVSLLLPANLAVAQSATLEQCQHWQAEIEYYTQLRRAGGSAAQMERWKQQRAEYEEQFRENRCLRYGRLLRESS